MAHKIEHQLSLYSKRKTINSTIHSILKHKQSGTLTSTLNAKSTASILKKSRELHNIMYKKYQIINIKKKYWKTKKHTKWHT